MTLSQWFGVLFPLALICAVMLGWQGHAMIYAEPQGRHHKPKCPPVLVTFDAIPDVPELDVPELDVPDWVNPSAERLATTGELRALAFDGDMDRINSEIAAFRAVNQLREWTRS